MQSRSKLSNSQSLSKAQLAVAKHHEKKSNKKAEESMAVE